nr:hypothetical protein [Tanacetum cinerariifolium]
MGAGLAWPPSLTAGASSATFGAPATVTCYLSGPEATQAYVSSISTHICNLTSSVISIIGRSGSRLSRIHKKELHKVHVFDFGGLSDLMVGGLGARMLIDHRDDQGVRMFTSRAWRWLFDIRGPLVHELNLEFFGRVRFGEAILDLDTTRALQFQLGGARRRMSWR